MMLKTRNTNLMLSEDHIKSEDKNKKRNGT